MELYVMMQACEKHVHVVKYILLTLMELLHIGVIRTALVKGDSEHGEIM
jgi:hypothetical protein